MIVETFQLTASDSDVLKAPSRLAAIPSAGVLTLECSANVCAAANHWDLAIRDAEGDVPIRDCRVPANGMGDGSNAIAGVLHGSTEWVIAIPVEQGQHVGVDATLTGTADLFIRATLKP